MNNRHRAMWRYYIRHNRDWMSDIVMADLKKAFKDNFKAEPVYQYQRAYVRLTLNEGSK